VDADALNIDFAPTVLDLAGLSLPKEMQGRSWRPLLGGQRPADWRSAFFYENFRDPPYPDQTFDIVGVRADDAKLMTYPAHPDWAQLFDLKADPYEMHNLINDPAAADLRKRMEDELKRQAEKVGFEEAKR